MNLCINCAHYCREATLTNGEEFVHSAFPEPVCHAHGSSINYVDGSDVWPTCRQLRQVHGETCPKFEERK